MADVTLAVRDARIVFPDGIIEGDLYVRHGRVAAVGDLDLTADETVDASGLLILPGMVDAHVHFMDPGEPEREDFPTGSAAAAVAGVTTVLEHTHARPVYDRDDLSQKRAYLEDRSVVDFGLGAHLSPHSLDDAIGVCAEGAAFLKVFTCETHGIQAVDAGRLLEAMQRIDSGHGVFLVHAEDDALTAAAEESLRTSGRDDGRVIPEWRSPLAERIAVDMVARLAAATDARVVVAHCSHAEVVDSLARYRDRGAELYAESCPQYLFLQRDEVCEHRGLRKFTPPARAGSERDLERMWERLRSGGITYLASDHAPATREQKTAGTIWEVVFGLPGVDTTLPLMLDAVHRGRLDWSRLVQIYSAGPARTYGLYPRKGSLLPGADADFILVDPEGTRILEDKQILSKAGWSPYSGRRLHGKIVSTFLGGQRIAAEGRCLAAPGTGRFLPGIGFREG